MSESCSSSSTAGSPISALGAEAEGGRGGPAKRAVKGSQPERNDDQIPAEVNHSSSSPSGRDKHADEDNDVPFKIDLHVSRPSAVKQAVVSSNSSKKTDGRKEGMMIFPLNQEVILTGMIESTSLVVENAAPPGPLNGKEKQPSAVIKGSSIQHPRVLYLRLFLPPFITFHNLIHTEDAAASLDSNIMSGGKRESSDRGSSQAAKIELVENSSTPPPMKTSIDLRVSRFPMLP